MSQYNTYSKLNNLMASYVPEFNYQEESQEPGCVLTSLCGDMIEESAKRYDHVIHKHKLQYLNLFENLREEPVSSSKGYVQFEPITGYEGDILVPEHTTVLANVADVGEILYHTKHDLAVTIAKPQVIVNTDREKDVVVRHLIDQKEPEPFMAFSIAGHNESDHTLYLGYESLFDVQTSLDFRVYITAHNQELFQQSMELLLSSQVQWSIQDDEEEACILFDVIERDGDSIHFVKYDYQPKKSVVEGKEAYYIVLEVVEGCPEVPIETISISLSKQTISPEEIYVNQVYEDANARAIYPFGKPLGLYNEFAMEQPEVFARSGAKIDLEFQLQYELHEELIEVHEVDLEYKTIMKRPQKSTVVKSLEVAADTVIWEYLSETGWKHLMKEESITSLFNGKSEGLIKLSFVCPSDIAPIENGANQGRIRARLMRAENIYKMPAVYSCPMISEIKFAYSYEDDKQFPDYACAKNCFELTDITDALQVEDTITLFYKTQQEGRCMYMGFDYSIAGMPTSIYFDLDNASDVQVEFELEYSTKNGFRRMRADDATGGFAGSGTMLLLIPRDMEKMQVYGNHGYYIRFIAKNQELQEYRLPKIAGIYMNMAKVANESKIEEVFYLDNFEETVDFRLKNINLLELRLWVQEIIDQHSVWVLWNRQEGFTGKARSYEVDLAAGTIHMDKIALCSASIDQAGPHIKVVYSTYTGSKANVPAGAIYTLQNSIRYISSIINPFPMYGGYDGYTEDSAAMLTANLLRTRNRAVTAKDFEDMIAQKSFGVRRVKCVSNVDHLGNLNKGTTTIAILIDEYAKGVHIFTEMKEGIREQLLESSNIVPLGKRLILSQPYFIKLNVSLWIEKKNMEQAYDLQNKATQLITDFINPLTGGADGLGWQIGEFPRASQIVAYLRTNIWDCNIEKIIMTAFMDGKEVDVRDEFYHANLNPFIMAVSGEHIIYIDITKS
ncbi:MAG: baseplate J/gp47 family protein [Eubacteriales bacterium]